MFTGIIEEVGSVKSIGSGKLVIRASKVLEGTILGDSIAVNGACLTVIEMSDNTFEVDIMPETLRRTSIGNLKTGDYVNKGVDQLAIPMFPFTPTFGIKYVF